MSIELFKTFLVRHCDPDDMRVEMGDPMELVETLWSYVELFQPGGPGHGCIDLPYDPAYEAEVDQMLEGMADAPLGDHATRTAEAGRVLLERVTQTIAILTEKAVSGDQVPMIPRSLSAGHRFAGAAILLLHQMELPFEPGTVDPPMRKRH